MTPFSNNEPYIKAGNSAANQEEYIEALELYLKAIQRDPKFKQSLKLNLYKCLNALGEEVDIDDFLPDAKEDRLNSWLEKIEIWISSNPELPRRKKVNLPATVKT
ncbi:MAG TPA: tetratricopeptide repeat protein, partial [Prochlorococcaceae cyanobacterium Fu_MAG_50]|nr:tetratricopeptide repeat protein [Prochlorococcaceae cyanobacterium Fu_MAG_50]